MLLSYTHYETMSDNQARDYSKLIEEFMLEWYQKKSYYKGISETARDLCKEIVSNEGIHAEYKYRVKDSTRLRAKCLDRATRKDYRTPKDIFADLVDLAGVRICLYFPNQKDRVSELIHKHFDVKETKPHPDPLEQGSEAQGHTPTLSRGYIATHFRVDLKDQQLKHGLVEIQVMSVLNGAWADVRHDIEYKALSGKVSAEEVNLLNGLNSLLLTGDWLLDTFHHTHMMRVKRINAPFANHFELTTYLSDRFSHVLNSGSEGMKLGNTFQLYDILRFLDDKGIEPWRIDDPALQHLASKPKANTPRALDIVIDSILREDGPNPSNGIAAQRFAPNKLTLTAYLLQGITANTSTVFRRQYKNVYGSDKRLIIAYPTQQSHYFSPNNDH
ncbi:hypothetical protein BDV96DRAFT_560880 [Lophiotrema nucula]|uniref:RelA/SpoT domain-containing protein n=1 Tax=Lophiotrema nucula TaxID=690887 RepID=A0A6A5ZVT7_9PLEO|nr:hypothetical protein BDV96DRAFT_560880 [Lophiotrema nucula]